MENETIDRVKTCENCRHSSTMHCDHSCVMRAPGTRKKPPVPCKCKRTEPQVLDPAQ